MREQLLAKREFEAGRGDLEQTLMQRNDATLLIPAHHGAAGMGNCRVLSSGHPGGWHIYGWLRMARWPDAF